MKSSQSILNIVISLSEEVRIFVVGFLFGVLFCSVYFFKSVGTTDIEFYKNVHNQKQKCESELPVNVGCKIIAIKLNEATEATNSSAK